MKKRLNLLALLFIAFGISILACGTESDNEELDPENMDFTISWPDGGEVITEDWDGNAVRIILRYDNSRYESVVEFNDDYASGSGWNRSEVGQSEVPGINCMNLAAGLTISVDPAGRSDSGVIYRNVDGFVSSF